jgi:hypothetical protein
MAGMAQLGSNNAYFATGDMTINWSFNRGAGSVGGTFDNKAYSGALAITPGTPNVSGQIQMTGGPSVSGPLTGSFFSSPTDPAKYIAGAFGVKGTVSGTPSRPAASSPPSARLRPKKAGIGGKSAAST